MAACVALLSTVPAGAAIKSTPQPARPQGSQQSHAVSPDHETRDHSDHSHCGRRPKLAYVESGILMGEVSGAQSYAFSRVVGVMEVGLLAGARTGRSRQGWGIGATGFFGGGANDFRLGFKPRIRYRFTPGFATDVSAGPFWTLPIDGGQKIDRGYLASVAFQLGTWFTLRGDFQTRPVPGLSSYNHYTGERTQAPGGDETAVYVGMALRDRPGWAATMIGTATVASLFLLAMAIVLGSGGWS
jgi:hypothetical protein